MTTYSLIIYPREIKDDKADLAVFKALPESNKSVKNKYLCVIQEDPHSVQLKTAAIFGDDLCCCI